ncbi:MAG: hypothetical protein H7Z16_10180 [Pyrinomonadaceae bacterium]|nr:hypothetical protein [Pyrinomonadaceae bacterium]
MKKCVTAILLILTTASFALSVQEPAEWIKHSSPEGRYSVLLPAQPTIGTQESATADGEKFTQYKATLVEGNGVYLIGYFDCVAGTTYSLDKGRDGMVEAVKGTLLSESAISLGGSPGRELKVAARTPNGTEFILSTRIYDVDKRVYVLQFVSPKSEDGNGSAKATRFFDSFQVTKIR